MAGGTVSNTPPAAAAVHPDRTTAGFGAPGDAVLHELGGLQLVAVGPGFYQISAYRLVACEREGVVKAGW